MERIDIYDSDRRPTGRTAGSPKELADREYRLVIHLCLFNSRGEMLIQRRRDSCARWPGRWDVSVRGCADTGETGREAAMREAREELGLDLDLTGLRPALTVSFPHGFDELFLVEAELDPAALTLQESEVAAVRWAGEEEILRLRESGQFTPFHPEYLHLLFRMFRTRDVMENDAN